MLIYCLNWSGSSFKKKVWEKIVLKSRVRACLLFDYIPGKTMELYSAICNPFGIPVLGMDSVFQRGERKPWRQRSRKSYTHGCQQRTSASNRASGGATKQMAVTYMRLRTCLGTETVCCTAHLDVGEVLLCNARNSSFFISIIRPYKNGSTRLLCAENDSGWTSLSIQRQAERSWKSSPIFHDRLSGGVKSWHDVEINRNVRAL